MIEKPTPNYFVRMLIVLFCILVMSLILFNFFLAEPEGEIGNGLIVLLIILMVVMLSESFDQFSVGKLLQISRDNKRKAVKIGSLSEENDELRKQLITVATTVSQNQSSTNIIGLPDDLARRLIVKSATQEEIQDEQIDESTADEIATIQRTINRPDFRKIEEVGISEFLSRKNLDSGNLIREAKLTSEFHGIDGISNDQPIFDGYLNTVSEEIFIEVRPGFSPTGFWWERIYRMLNKIKLYRQLKDTKAYLYLVLVILPESVLDRPTRSNRERVARHFEPAVANGLLRIIEIELSEEQARSCVSDGR